MAMSIIFICDQCGFSVEDWDDGNPYIEYPKGKRHCFYHPNGEDTVVKVAKRILGHSPAPEELGMIYQKYTGNAPDYICRDCGDESKIDPDKDKLACSHCGSGNVVTPGSLCGGKCIKCSGQFSEGEMGAIS